MKENKEYVRKLANSLISGKTMYVEELRNKLNENEFFTTRGTEYKKGRGIYKLISATFHWLEAQNLLGEAQKVAKAFVKPNGSYAYA